MSGISEAIAVKEAVVILATAGVVVPLIARLNVNPVLGYLLAGVVFGPDALGALASKWSLLEPFAVTSRERIAGVAEFGIVVLMFMIGLELSFERMTTMRRLVFGLGALQVAATATALAVAAILWGLPIRPAAIIGAALALSSTAIVIEVLAKSKRLRSTAGRASFAVLLFQDIAVIPILFVIGVLSGDQSNLAGGLGLAVAKVAIAIVVIIGVGRLALRPLFRLVVEQKSTDMFMAACLLVIAATAQVSAMAGLSMALGAFIAGLLLAETEYRREIEVTIEPFRGLLLGVFFFFVGMSIDLGEVLRRPHVIVALTLGMMLIKAALLYLLARLYRIGVRASLETSLLLAAGGEFAFVVLAAAGENGAMPADMASIGLAVASLSMATTPLLALIGAKLNPRARAEAAPAADFEPPPEDDVSRVLLLGYGRAGQLIGSMLDEFKIPFNAIDEDLARVAAKREAGRRIYYGDATRPEFLRRCGIARARAVVISLNPQKPVERIVAAVRAERSDILIIARARDMAHARALHAQGVDEAVPETFEASLQLSEALLVGLGAPMGLVLAQVHEVRDRNRAEINKIEPAGRADARSKLRARMARIQEKNQEKGQARAAGGQGE
ncbi:cation:proton antiporter [Terrarubrum flagellatum]|uniref:cation:proton antiporter domain-containing protein n=1 Tax=Terrirubrum flagellatum TaxID=2895980 RepID=UPI003144E44E